MATEYTLGASASCSDGHCGEVIRVILDPAARTVTHLVVEPPHRPVDGRLVPVAMIDAGASEIGLRCTLAEFDRLDASEEIEFVEGMDYGGGYGSPDAIQGVRQRRRHGRRGWQLRRDDRRQPGSPPGDGQHGRRPRR